jgi:hypothetical protein
VPDEAGWQPHHEAIDSSHSPNHTLRSTLPLDELAGGDAAARAATCTTCVAVVPAERRAIGECVICHLNLTSLHLSYAGSLAKHNVRVSYDAGELMYLLLVEYLANICDAPW